MIFLFPRGTDTTALAVRTATRAILITTVTAMARITTRTTTGRPTTAIQATKGRTPPLPEELSVGWHEEILATFFPRRLIEKKKILVS